MSESSTLDRTVNRKPSSLTLEAGWKKRLKPANVLALCGEMSAGRVLPPIKVTGDSRVVVGRHRIAAAMLWKHLDKHVPGTYGDPKHDGECEAKIVRWANGANFELSEALIRCDVIEYADADAAKIDEYSENLRRQILTEDEKNEALVGLVKLHERRLKAEAEAKAAEAAAVAKDEKATKPAKGAKPKKAAGRPKSISSKAREAAAASAGVSKDTVDRAMERVDEAGAAPVNAGPALDWFGLEPIADVDGAARKVRQAIAEAAVKHLMTGRLINAAGDAKLPKSIVEGLDRAWSELNQALTDAAPTHACPSCKAALRRTCASCGGVGYATAGQMRADVPAELLKRGDEAQVRDGKGAFRVLHPATTETKKGKGKKKGGATVVVDGVEVDAAEFVANGGAPNAESGIPADGAF